MKTFIFYFDYRGMHLEYHIQARGKREANRLARARMIAWHIAVDQYLEQQKEHSS